jgi:hypothetical protein
MARSQKRVRTTHTRTTTTGRTTRAESRKAAPAAVAADVEVVEESRGMTFDDAIAIIVAVVLLTAIVLLEIARGSGYGAGMFA